ncbi:MAG: hypothetical protein JNL74_19780 [Fibrobacteres bacterium]|nr:hypothetical protein [Fibrobacterota bacterium]
MIKRTVLLALLVAGFVFPAPKKAVDQKTKDSGVITSDKNSRYKNLVKGGVHFYAFTGGFPNSHTIWSSIGITDKDVVYSGVCDHTINVGIFKYNPVTDSISYLGDILGLGKMTLQQWQGKVHTALVQNPRDGLVYFGTDAGNGLWEGVGIPEFGYTGGHWFTINPVTDEVKNMGRAVPFLGLKSIAVDPVYNRIFATTDPNSHFIVYDVEKGKSGDFEVYSKANQDLGCINGIHEPRMSWCDKWGNAYTSNEAGQFVKFNGKTGELTRLNRTVLPYALGTASYLVGSGPSAIVSVDKGSYFYGVTYYGRLFKFTPEENGDGSIEDLGHGWGSNDERADGLKVGNLALNKEKTKLYYVIGGHGQFVTKDSSAILVEFDLAAKTKTHVYTFDKIVTECTGGVTDSKGNIFFGAHGQSVPVPGEETLRKPYLVKFDPAKIERVK